MVVLVVTAAMVVTAVMVVLVVQVARTATLAMVVLVVQEVAVLMVPTQSHRVLTVKPAVKVAMVAPVEWVVRLVPEPATVMVATVVLLVRLVMVVTVRPALRGHQMVVLVAMVAIRVLQALVVRLGQVELLA